MNLYFDHPWLLLTAVLAVPLVLLGWRATIGMDALRRVFALGVRTVVLGGLAVLLASPHSVREHHQLTVVGLLDISASVQRFAELPQTDDLGDRSYLEYLRQWFRTGTEIKQPDDRFALIVFDGRATAITTPSTERYLDDTFAITTMEGTNIADAIQLGLAMFPGDTARRLVLVSDGNETLGSALDAARQAAGARGASTAIEHVTVDGGAIPIDVLPIAYNVTRDVQVVRIEAPPQAQAAQTVTVRVVLESTQPTTGRLTLRHEGRFIDLNGAAPGVAMPIDVPAGQSVQRLPVRLLDSKINRYEAVFEPDDPAADTLKENNRAEAFTATPAEGRVLIVDDAADRRANLLAAIFAEAALQVDVIAPVEFPADLLSMQRYDLIVLDNIPAYALPVDQHELLARYVNDLGGGLIMTGGESSFGAGGWNGTAVESILPLELDPPRELRLATAALVLVLDRSGSMNRPVAGARASQQDVANEGAALAVESLRETSYVGVVTFDLFAHEHVPLQRNDNPGAIADRIRAIQADGGTNLLPALTMAHRMLNTVDVEKKRVVCLSDGQSPTDGLETQVQRMVDDGIQVTTIAVGDDADFQTLAALAQIGQGAFYEVRNPRVLPSVLIDSVQIINKPLIREGVFEPVVASGASSLAAGMQSAPPLMGLVITAPKPSPAVQVELAHPDGEPLLAQWQAGLGRVAAFTSSTQEPWAGAWRDWPTAATFWTQLARRTSRPGMNQDTELVTRIDGDQLLVTLNVLDEPAATGEPSSVTGAASALSLLQVDGTVYRPDGTSDAIRLRQTGPDQYTASIPATQSGNYIVALTPRRAGQPMAPVLGGVSRTSSAELRRYQSDIELLREIAQTTNGRILELSDPLAVSMFERDSLPRSRSILPVWRPLLLLALALLLVDIANRRIAWSTTGLIGAVRRAASRAQSQRSRASEIATAVGSLRRSGAADRAPIETVSGRETTQRERAEVTFRMDETPAPSAPQPDAPPQSPRETKPSAPDRSAIESALDELLGRSASPQADAPTPTRQTNEDEGTDDADTRTGGLLEAKRRAQQRFRDENT